MSLGPWWTCLIRVSLPAYIQRVFEGIIESDLPAVARHPNRAVMLRIPEVPGTSPVQYSSSLEPTTYAQLQVRRNALGSALLALEREGRLKTPSIPGPTPVEITHPGTPHFGSHNRAKAGARRGWAVGTWSKNREEWQVIDLACQAYGLVGVSLYETLGPDVAQYM
jgi:long-chain acyl-CoA synthetase